MINQQLLQPESIVVIGGSNNVHKPGGAVIRNILNGGYQGVLRVVNPKEDEIQGIKVFHDVKQLPTTDLAIWWWQHVSVGVRGIPGKGKAGACIYHYLGWFQ